MPIYEYQCSSCNSEESHFQRMDENRKRTCSKCKKKTLNRKISASNIIFKGKGFYCNDYPKKT